MSLNTYQLKYIALLSMVIDHAGVIFRSQLPDTVYLTMRCMGRIAFPVFCFTLVEGFFHSSNRNRYLTRLLLFAILSEVPFDLALKGTFWNIIHHPSIYTVMDWSSQNVFFTLSLGFVAMMILDQCQDDKPRILITVIVFSLAGEILQCDYGSTGIVTILLFYFVRKYGQLPLIGAYLPLMLLGLRSRSQPACILSFPLLQSYNGEKGRGSRYFFYIAYPVHLTLLLFLRYWLQSLR